MAPTAMTSASEHWLTLMTCVVCECTPDETPVYLCNLGHTICLNCFTTMTKKGMPQCTICESTKFEAKTVSTDFLKKLKMKPGIGRPCRYEIKPSRTPSPSLSAFDVEQRDDTVTLEKLFQMPSEKIQELFDRTTKQKLKKIRENTFSIALCKCHKNKASIQKSWNLINDNKSECFAKRYEKSMLKEFSSTSMYSRKPLHCPHHPCNKIIAMSSFNTHFAHEHSDLKRYNVCRGHELNVAFDPTLFEYHRTYCLGLITLYNGEIAAESYDQDPSKITQFFNQKIPLDTFWVMASGSSDAKKKQACVIFWLFINNDNSYNCTLDLDSQEDEMSLSTYCSVNGMRGSHDIQEVTQSMNCLYVTYGGLESILEYGPNPKFRIVVY